MRQKKRGEKERNSTNRGVKKEGEFTRGKEISEKRTEKGGKTMSACQESEETGSFPNNIEIS